MPAHQSSIIFGGQMTCELIKARPRRGPLRLFDGRRVEREEARGRGTEGCFPGAIHGEGKWTFFFLLDLFVF
jgi:hypothetical protein